MEAESYKLMDGRLFVYRRDNTKYWQCSTYIRGRNYRQTTKEDNLAHAKAFAKAWFMELHVEDRRRRSGGNSLLMDGLVEVTIPASSSMPDRRRRTPSKGGVTFRQVTEIFKKEYEAITLGERSEAYVASKDDQIKVHLLPFFGDTPIADVTAGMVQEYRAHRQTSRTDKEGKPKKPARATLHGEIVTLRQLLKLANRKGWIDAVPDMSAPYKQSGKIEHRAWFSPEEYQKLYEHTRKRADNPPNPRWKDVCENFHDYVLFMGNTGLRPDESARLELRDVKIVKDEDTKETILEIEVRGKRGVGYCKSMPGAVFPFERIRDRKKLQPNQKIFGKTPREMMNQVLGKDELDMKFDRDGHMRTCYSLRHTYICLRLLEGADIYQVAKNCRTSVEMIEKYYARHLANAIDTAAINVMKPKKKEKKLAKKKNKKDAKTKTKNLSK